MAINVNEGVFSETDSTTYFKFGMVIVNGKTYLKTPNRTTSIKGEVCVWSIAI